MYAVRRVKESPQEPFLILVVVATFLLFPSHIIKVDNSVVKSGSVDRCNGSNVTNMRVICRKLDTQLVLIVIKAFP